MVFYFTTKVEGKEYILYMGKDKYENEDLIKYGWPDDLWFHVDKLSSAHVYIRLPEGEGPTWRDLPEELIKQCGQLVKANSIEGCKQASVHVVYTPWSNLQKTAQMDVGQVGFHSAKEVKKFVVEKENSIVNALNRTKEERFPNLRQERDERMARERRRQLAAEKEARAAEEAEIARKREEAKLRSYDTLFEAAGTAPTNREQSRDYKEAEDDFM